MVDLLKFAKEHSREARLLLLAWMSEEAEEVNESFEKSHLPKTIVSEQIRSVMAFARKYTKDHPDVPQQHVISLPSSTDAQDEVLDFLGAYAYFVRALEYDVYEYGLILEPLDLTIDLAIVSDSPRDYHAALGRWIRRQLDRKRSVPRDILMKLTPAEELHPECQVLNLSYRTVLVEFDYSSFDGSLIATYPLSVEVNGKTLESMEIVHLLPFDFSRAIERLMKSMKGAPDASTPTPCTGSPVPCDGQESASGRIRSVFANWPRGIKLTSEMDEPDPRTDETSEASPNS